MHRTRTAIVSTFALFTIAGSSMYAQLTNANQESIRIPVGGILEIQAVGSNTMSWVLTQNREFIEASRDPVFSTRFSRPGSYTLAAEASIGDTIVQRLFSISVLDRTPGNDAGNLPGGNAVTFEPALQNESIVLPRGKEIIVVTPERSDINILAIDTNTNVDSNNDGNTQNDDDTKGTLFRSEGNPLHLWMIGGKKASMRLGILFANGDTQFDTIHIGDRPIQPSTPSPEETQEQEPPAMEEESDDMQIQILKNDNGEVQFGLQMDIETKSTVVLLWNFGDGQQSMLDKPIHTFAESGEYTVSVEIRDLKTGEVQESVSDSVVVNRLLDEPSPTKDDPKKDTKKESGGSIFGLIFKLLLTLIISGIVGAGILFVISKVKNKGFSLEKSLEKAEEVMVKTPKETVEEAAPPMEIHASDEPIEETPVEVVEPTPTPPPPEPQPQPEPTPEPVPASAPSMPDWMQPQTQASEPAANTAPPPEEPVIDTPAPNVDHAALAPSADQLATDTTQAPDWLQSGIEKAEQDGQTATTPPPEPLQTEPVKEVIPEPTPEPVPEPQPALEPEQTPTPPSDKDQEREERLREKKRQKRQRYRENLKKRKAEEKEKSAQKVEENTAPSENMDEPVAFIKAEDIEPMEGNSENTALEQTSEEDEKQGS